MVSLMVIYPKNVRPQGRGQTKSLILRGLLKEPSEVLSQEYCTSSKSET
jgi:hypothetical protein